MWDEPFRLIKNDPLNGDKKSIAILYIGDIKEKYLDLSFSISPLDFISSDLALRYLAFANDKSVEEKIFKIIKNYLKF